jgi:hypothetical protein
MLAAALALGLLAVQTRAKQHGNCHQTSARVQLCRHLDSPLSRDGSLQIFIGSRMSVGP